MEPARRDRAQVVDMEDMIPAGGLCEARRGGVGDEVLDQVALDAIVEVTDVLAEA